MNTEQSYKITSGSVTMPAELDSAKREKFLQQLTMGVHLLTSPDGEQESFITIPK